MKRTDIELLLPEVFRQTVSDPGPLAALLDVMAAMHAPSEAALDSLAECFDPRRADDRFVSLLSRWVDLERLFVQSAIEAKPDAANAARPDGEPISTGIGRMRELIARAAELSQWRGTRRGLLAFLETATGAADFEIDEQAIGTDGTPMPFHIRIVAPAVVEPHRPLLERIIEIEKPAHVTYELQFAAQGA